MHPDNLFYAEMLVNLFDGGEGGGADSGAAAGTAGETQAAPGSTRPGKTGETQRILYGKQPSETNGAASADTDSGTAAAGQDTQEIIAEADPPQQEEKTPEEKRKAFLSLIRGEYKEQFTEESQRIINDRFKETAGMRQQLASFQPLLDLLSTRYDLQGGSLQDIISAVENDSTYLNAAADEAGMSVDQFRQVENAKRQMAEFNRWKAQQAAQQRQAQQVQQWQQQAQEVQRVYKTFDLRAEMQNPAFQSMLRAGVPMKNAYESVHHQEMMDAMQQAASRQMEKKVAASVRANGQRPAEAGVSSQAAFVVKNDPSKFTNEDFAEIAKRVARGETISF